MNVNRINFNRGRVIQEILKQQIHFHVSTPNAKVIAAAAEKLLSKDEKEFVAGCYQARADTESYCKRAWNNHAKALAASGKRRNKKNNNNNNNSDSGSCSETSISMESQTLSNAESDDENGDTNKQQTREEILNDKLREM